VHWQNAHTHTQQVYSQASRAVFKQAGDRPTHTQNEGPYSTSLEHASICPDQCVYRVSEISSLIKWLFNCQRLDKCQLKRLTVPNELENQLSGGGRGLWMERPPSLTPLIHSRGLPFIISCCNLHRLPVFVFEERHRSMKCHDEMHSIII